MCTLDLRHLSHYTTGYTDVYGDTHGVILCTIKFADEFTTAYSFSEHCLDLQPTSSAKYGLESRLMYVVPFKQAKQLQELIDDHYLSRGEKLGLIFRLKQIAEGHSLIKGLGVALNYGGVMKAINNAMRSHIPSEFMPIHSIDLGPYIPRSIIRTIT